MKLSKTAAQATLAMVYLADQHEGRFVQARHVAHHLGIALDSALKILQTLTRHNLIQSQLGRCGGYRLRQAATEVSLLSIIEAVDGRIDAEVPVTSCETMAQSIDVLQAVCEEVANRLRTQLSQTTLADMLPVADPAKVQDAEIFGVRQLKPIYSDSDALVRIR